MKKLLAFFLLLVTGYRLSVTPVFAACNPPEDYSDCSLTQTGPKIAGNIDPQNYQQIRNEYNQANPALANQQIPVTIIYTTADLNPAHIQETTANLQAMKQYGLHPVIRVASSGWGKEGWSRITPGEAAEAAQSLNQTLSQVQFSQTPVVYFGNEPNLPQEWGGQADVSSFAQSFATFIQAAGPTRSFQIFVPPVATHQGGVEYQFMQQILNYRLGNGQTIAQSVDGAALTVYNDSPQSLSSLYQQLAQFYQQNGVGNFVISELGPLVGGRLLQNREDVGEWTRIMSDVFAKLKTNPNLFAGAQFISTSFFLDTDGDGAPDVTLLVIIDENGNVIIMNLATLGGGVMLPSTFGACQSETPGEQGKGIAWGKTFEVEISVPFWGPTPEQELTMTLKGIKFNFPIKTDMVEALDKANEKLTPAGYTPKLSEKTAMGEVWYEVCELDSKNTFTVKGDESFDTPQWMDLTSSLGIHLENLLITSAGKSPQVQGINRPQVAGVQTYLAQSQSCSADNPWEIVPSCASCGDILFCFGNKYRLCETDPSIPAPTGNLTRWLSPGDFSSTTLRYNGMTFSIPSGGVYICDANVFGCNNECFEKEPSLPPQPASFCEEYPGHGGRQDDEEICIGGECKKVISVSIPEKVIQVIRDAWGNIIKYLPGSVTKKFLVTPVIKTPHAKTIDETLRTNVFSTFKPSTLDLPFKHTLTPAVHEVSASPGKEHESDSEIYGQKGVKEAHEWVEKALTPSALRF